LLSEPARWQPVKIPTNIRHLATSPPHGHGQIQDDKVKHRIQASGACNSCLPVLLLLRMILCHCCRRRSLWSLPASGVLRRQSPWPQNLAGFDYFRARAPLKGAARALAACGFTSKRNFQGKVGIAISLQRALRIQACNWTLGCKGIEDSDETGPSIGRSIRRSIAREPKVGLPAQCKR
jgi:hypothetical protein